MTLGRSSRRCGSGRGRARRCRPRRRRSGTGGAGARCSVTGSASWTRVVGEVVGERREVAGGGGVLGGQPQRPQRSGRTGGTSTSTAAWRRRGRRASRLAGSTTRRCCAGPTRPGRARCRRAGSACCSGSRAAPLKPISNEYVRAWSSVWPPMTPSTQAPPVSNAACHAISRPAVAECSVSTTGRRASSPWTDACTSAAGSSTLEPSSTPNRKYSTRVSPGSMTTSVVSVSVGCPSPLADGSASVSPMVSRRSGSGGPNTVGLRAVS